ncbi:hypothetical protein ACM66B_000583 [Microbotryomycetes sp. NB124-2]
MPEDVVRAAAVLESINRRAAEAVAPARTLAVPPVPLPRPQYLRRSSAPLPDSHLSRLPTSVLEYARLQQRTTLAPHGQMRQTPSLPRYEPYARARPSSWSAPSSSTNSRSVSSSNRGPSSSFAPAASAQLESMFRPPGHRWSQLTSTALEQNNPVHYDNVSSSGTGSPSSAATESPGDLRVADSEYRRFGCNEPGCDLRFARRNDLVRHTRIHTGEE